MYSIIFDIDSQILSEKFDKQYHEVITDIRSYLSSKGFDRQQGSVYFGNETIDAVKTVLAVQSLARKFPWFAPSVKDIQMLRIEENGDLLPAILEAID